ncbi:exonuclease SbcCD subunit D C-terminal domain-containing protein [Flavimarina sp. Hel_I_48]|uniref:exonuclease SbcCD subunit D C-terminal domain-containing protein n=1 Tax=Flavimarina sp. Hel_I_48 TaxID=1392488 RepID=UPI0004DF7F2A|nr:exonuclease SbcCD subunit D C-terminal domain-containing protein [Flavimarina sp. Hel_I_48]
MKILHTADWHIGKKLHKHDLYKDFDLFAAWLHDVIKKQDISLLLVSGDVFDLANPSSEARQQYYRTLMQLRGLNCTVIITGGNHDSPDMLNAPKELLKALDVHVQGGIPKNIEECLIPVYDKDKKLELVVAALPYLRDADLRKTAVGNSYEDRLEQIREGIKNTFAHVAELAIEHYPDLPILAMAHLFTAGIEPSESERDIQVGNQAAFSAAQFGDCFKYIALGHIHKPQRVNALVPAFYSGSPLPLSFSERTDEKRVLVLDTEKSWEHESIAVPSFRKLLKISGDLTALRKKLDALQEHTGLDSLIEIELKEAQYDATKIIDLDDMVTGFAKPGYEIVKHRATFIERQQSASQLYGEVAKLEDLEPKDVFEKRIDEHPYDHSTRQDIISAFDELLEIAQKDNSL